MLLTSPQSVICTAEDEKLYQNCHKTGWTTFISIVQRKEMASQRFYSFET